MFPVADSTGATKYKIKTAGCGLLSDDWPVQRQPQTLVKGLIGSQPVLKLWGAAVAPTRR